MSEKSQSPMTWHNRVDIQDRLDQALVENFNHIYRDRFSSILIESINLDQELFISMFSSQDDKDFSANYWYLIVIIPLKSELLFIGQAEIISILMEITLINNSWLGQNKKVMALNKSLLGWNSNIQLFFCWKWRRLPRGPSAQCSCL